MPGLRAVTTLRAGCARLDITPEWPLPLAGFASRTGLSEGIASPLHLRVVLLESRTGDTTARAVIVSADILWWAPELVAGYQDKLARLVGAPGQNVVLAATHNHSGPQTSGRFAPSLGLPDPRFTSLLENALLRAVASAEAALEPVTVRTCRGAHHLGVHRRAWIDGEFQLAPNPDGPSDPELTVVAFERADGSPHSLLVHYACHPVISSANLISGEYPGAAMRALEERTDAVSLYLQGCSGDINPAGREWSRFASGGEDEITRCGLALADRVQELRAAHGEHLAPVPIRSESRDLPLLFEATPTDGEIVAASMRPGVDGEWGRALLEDASLRQPSTMLAMRRLDIADQLSLLTMHAEMVVEYGLFAKAISAGKALPVSCCNGMIGYLPTAAQIAEGGYEPDGSTRYFLLPSRFSPAIEDDVKRAIERLTSDRATR
jgi:neutral/alkaline ceramidase-like enzyme